MQIPDLKTSSNVKMFAVEHGMMNKVMIMNDNKMFTINVYDTGFISP